MSSALLCALCFDFAAPKKLHEPLKFWATNYFLYSVEQTSAGTIPLLDLKGHALGPKLTKKEWCAGALEGTLRVVDEKSTRTFNYAGVGPRDQIACNIAHSPGTNRVRFEETNTQYGTGVEDLKLVPFRSLAVAPSEIPYGSLVYISAARGKKFKLDNGEEHTHDGYFFASDTAKILKADAKSKVRHHHLDVFTGLQKETSFEFISSIETERTEVYLIQDSEISKALRTAHEQRLK